MRKPLSNAGTIGFAFIERAEPETWRRCFEVNVVAPMQWAKAVVPSMRQHHSGRIINVSSIAAVISAPSFGAYCESKAALDQLSACLAPEVANDGISVLAFAPAAHTAMSRQLYENEEIPVALRAEFRTRLLENGDDMLRYTLQMFRFIATGGALVSTPFATASIARTACADKHRAAVLAQLALKVRVGHSWLPTSVPVRNASSDAQPARLQVCPDSHPLKNPTNPRLPSAWPR